jgi:hypothetical protein
MDVVAFLFCAPEQEISKIISGETGAHNELLETKNEHHVFTQWSIRFPRPLSHRDGVFSSVFQELEGGECILSITSTEHAAATSRDNNVRFTGTRLLRFSQVTPTVTRFTATSTFDLNGSIPRFVSDTLTTPAAARAPLNAIGYFLQIKETAEFDAGGQDARALGQLLVHEMEPVRTKKRPEELESEMRTFMDRTTVLRELVDVYPWFERLLLEALRNRLRVPKGSMKELAEFTEEDARKAGRGFANALIANAPAEAAVDEWGRTYPALGGLEER